MKNDPEHGKYVEREARNRLKTVGHDTEATHEHSEQSNGGLGSNGRDLIKDFIGLEPFGGGYQAILEEFLDIFDELADMCQVPGLHK